MLQYSQFNSYLQTSSCGSISCCVGVCCGAEARCASLTRKGEEKGLYRVLVGKPEGKRPLGRPRRRWVDNIRMYLQEVGCRYMD